MAVELLQCEIESAAPVAAPVAAQAVIEIESLHKVYDLGEVQVHALRGISLKIYPGEFVAVMGASGSGKSTLMNLIGCLDRPTRGAYRLDGQDVSTMSKEDLAHVRNRKIGFVFQGFNLLSRTSALENVELPMMYSNVAHAERTERAHAALRAVGLAGREGHNPAQLSGGQQQRVAIARSLVNNPAILVADEPTGNLDTRTSVEIMEIFQRLNAEHQITIILVTHEADIAQYAKRVVVVQDGRIRRDAAVEGRLDARQVLAELPAGDDELDEKEA